MKWNVVLGSLVLAMGVCTQGFSGGLLDRMLGASGCCSSSCCEATCGAASACCDDGCDPGCGVASCDDCCNGCDSGCCDGGCDSGCCEPTCGAASSCGCSKKKCRGGLLSRLFSCKKSNCCSSCCSEPTCGVADCCDNGCDSGCCDGGCCDNGCDSGCCDNGCDSGCCEPTCGAASSCGCSKKCRGGLLAKLFSGKKKSCCSTNGCEPTCGAAGCCDGGCSAAPTCGCVGTSTAQPEAAVSDDHSVPPAPVVDPSASKMHRLNVIKASHKVTSRKVTGHKASFGRWSRR